MDNRSLIITFWTHYDTLIALELIELIVAPYSCIFIFFTDVSTVSVPHIFPIKSSNCFNNLSSFLIENMPKNHANKQFSLQI